MVIEDYYDENYLGEVRKKENVKNYKNYYFGYTDELTEEETIRLLALGFFAHWFGIIDLEKMEMLNDQDIEIILGRQKGLWDKYIPNTVNKEDEKFFFDSFHYNDEKQF